MWASISAFIHFVLKTNLKIPSRLLHGTRETGVPFWVFILVHKIIFIVYSEGSSSWSFHEKQQNMQPVNLWLSGGERWIEERKQTKPLELRSKKVNMFSNGISKHLHGRIRKGKQDASEKGWESPRGEKTSLSFDCCLKERKGKPCFSPGCRSEFREHPITNSRLSCPRTRDCTNEIKHSEDRSGIMSWGETNQTIGLQCT